MIAYSATFSSLSQLKLMVISVRSPFSIMKQITGFLFLLLTGLLITCQSFVINDDRIPLSDEIMHYEVLSYNTSHILKQCEQYSQSTSSVDSSQTKQLFISLSFKAMDRQFNLMLWPASGLLAPGSRLFVQQNDGSLISADYAAGHGTLYQGKHKGDQFSHVHGHIINGVFDGVVTLGNHQTYLIEYAHKYFNHSTEFHSVIYSDQSILNRQPYHTDLMNKYHRSADDLIMPQVNMHMHQQTAKRSILPIPKNKFCYTRIVADERFLASFSGGSVQNALSEILYMFAIVQGIFRNADFDDDGEPDNITVSLLETTILTAADPEKYGNDNISGRSLHQLFSKQNNSRFCLALLLTYRNFNNYILFYNPGRLRTNYGICKKFNTAVVTLNFRGRKQTPFIGGLTIAHGFGHSFGAHHDPPNVKQCSPGLPDGNFIMDRFITSDMGPNKLKFSKCNNFYILQLLHERLACFKSSPVCGNGIVEEGEECDCRTSISCPLMMELCCNPENCTIASNEICRDRNHQCQCVINGNSTDKRSGQNDEISTTISDTKSTIVLSPSKTGNANQPSSLVVTWGSVSAAAVLLVIIALIILVIIGLVYTLRRRKSNLIDNEIDIHMQALCSNNYIGKGSARKRPKIVPETLPLLSPVLVLSQQIQIHHKIGSGEFGIVYKASFVQSKESGYVEESVAVKTLKGPFYDDELQDLIKESLKMKELHHPNVVKLLGVCLDAGPAPYIVLPYMANGDLLSYLRKHKYTLLVTMDNEENKISSVRARLTSMCLQISRGMEYLAGQNIVHRDLAARNCMIDADGVIKVADFGLSKSMYEKMYFRQDKSEGVKLPIKWLAIECMEYGVFSEKSDVWAFGVTCWEVFSVGKIPYGGVSTLSIATLLKDGERMEPPDNAACTSEINQTAMQQCWHGNPDDRPTFSQLQSQLGAILSAMTGYLELLDITVADDKEEHTYF